jgi:hypothetical protein
MGWAFSSTSNQPLDHKWVDKLWMIFSSTLTAFMPLNLHNGKSPFHNTAQMNNVIFLYLSACTCIVKKTIHQLAKCTLLRKQNIPNCI